MNEHANLKKIFWVLLGCIVVIFITLSITGQGNQEILDGFDVENTSNPSDEKALNTPSEQEQSENESRTQKQLDDYLSFLKENKVYAVGGVINSVSMTEFQMMIAEDLRYPVSGKQNISVSSTSSIEKATCTTTGGGGDIPSKSCTTETISLSDLKNGATVLVSLDEELFKKDGTLVAKAILVQ